MFLQLSKQKLWSANLDCEILFIKWSVTEKRKIKQEETNLSSAKSVYVSHILELDFWCLFFLKLLNVYIFHDISQGISIIFSSTTYFFFSRIQLSFFLHVEGLQPKYGLHIRKGCFVFTDFISRIPSFLNPKPPDPKYSHVIICRKKILNAQEGQQSGFGETKVTVLVSWNSPPVHFCHH